MVATAVGAAAGALHPARWGLLAGIVLGVVSLIGRRAALIPLAALLVTSGLAQRSLDGLDGVRETLLVGDVTLLTDPEPSFGGLRADVRAGGRRLEARANGASARALADRLAGEVVALRGEVAPVEGDASWLASRHVSGRLTILAVDEVRPGHPVSRLANGLRRTLVAGTATFDLRQRSLFTGLVLGDDRAQPADLADAFQGAGLTHLLAVSGQNVAFVLALAGPVLRRLRLWPRLAATVAVIGLFGVMTRFEPSVLRASAMAALAATVAMVGWPVARVRIIALAVTGLLVVDPLLARSVGFQLSVCAATAIVVVAPPLASALPGPPGLRDALAVTVAAQLGVAPVLLSAFGPIPVASAPANLLAVPVAGLVMVWGLTAGIVAGVAGGSVASLLHGPTRLALGWLDLVASRGSQARLGELGWVQIGVMALGLGAAVVARAGSRVRPVAWGLVLAVLGSAALGAHAPVPLRSAPLTGVVRWHAGGTDVIVLGGVGGRTALGASAVLAALRRGGVREVDLLVVADGSVPEGVIAAVERAHPTGAVLVHEKAASDGVLATATVAPSGRSALDVGAVTVRLVDAGERLVVEAAPRPP